jgi:hypothetical protein
MTSPKVARVLFGSEEVRAYIRAHKRTNDDDDLPALVQPGTRRGIWVFAFFERFARDEALLASGASKLLDMCHVIMYQTRVERFAPNVRKMVDAADFSLVQITLTQILLEKGGYEACLAVIPARPVDSAVREHTAMLESILPSRAN